MKQLFSYVDFREYIRDFYLEKKREAKFSYREFSKLAGFSSPVFIKLVIEGKANVRKTSIAKLCNAMGLKKEERRYFKNLVLFSQAKDLNTKMQYLNTMKSIQTNFTLNDLTNEQFEYVSKWYLPVVKELLTIVDFDKDYENLAKIIYPKISAKQAEEAIAILKKLELVKEINGKLVTTKNFFTTAGLTVGSLAIKNVQKKMAHLAASAIDTVPKEERDISGISLCVSSDSVAQIADELAKCRKRIMEIASQNNQCNAVYRVNLHLFPLSKIIQDGQLKQNGKGQ